MKHTLALIRDIIFGALLIAIIFTAGRLLWMIDHRVYPWNALFATECIAFEQRVPICIGCEG